MKLHAIPALDDNYIWLLENDHQQGVIIDPGDALPVIEFIQQTTITPAAILLTHHHLDHVGGVNELIHYYPDILVYGPNEVVQNHHLPINIVTDGEQIPLIGVEFSVIEVPGHTLGHVAYYSAPYLFCGDTLFSAGCGRIFEGSYQQMFDSINRLAELPNETLICCAHEYTLNNLKFAHAVVPDDTDITQWLDTITKLRLNGLITEPTTLRQEKNINLFLRCNDPVIQNKLNTKDPVETFSKLRFMKDNY